MSSGSRKALIIVASVLYATSFFLPTVAPFNADLAEIRITGWEAFRAGWRALQIFEPREPDAWIFGGAWLANPLFWGAGVANLYERRRAASILAWVAVLLCLPVLFRYGEILVGQPGYWCWLGSIVLLAVMNSFWVTTQAKPAIGKSGSSNAVAVAVTLVARRASKGQVTHRFKPTALAGAAG